jgi:glycosyltransferase involved in cell wall biosynthesis
MLEETSDLVADGVRQRMLCHGTRYQFSHPSEFMDRVVGRLAFLFPQKIRRAISQRVPGFVETLMRNLVRSLYGYEQTDIALAKRLAQFIDRDRVTHVKMSFGAIAPLALEAKNYAQMKFDYLITFQGDEEFAYLAAGCGLFSTYCRRVEEAMAGARWPSIAVSRHYARRLATDLGLDVNSMTVIYNGVNLPPASAPAPFSVLLKTFPQLRPDLPIVAYVGRQESEKGIDLLLYAAKILRERNVEFQLVICGATAKGLAYRIAMQDIIGHLRIEVHLAGVVSNETRDALYAQSRCVVCPSINGEPFGLVVAEAMARGAPTVVPDYGGVTEVVSDGDLAGGVIFKTWDSGDLARQVERLLLDDALHGELASNARKVAARFSTDRMIDAFLHHIELI